MDEKLQYASMLEIPVNTCNITYKPLKKNGKKKKTNLEEIKNQLVDKVNCQNGEATEKTENVVLEPKTDSKRKFKLTAVSLELIVIAVLCATILLTNIFMDNSGINVFMKSVFGDNTKITETNEKLYSEFTPVFNCEEDVCSTKDGITTVSKVGSVYSVLDGKVSALYKEDEKYTMEISHSDNFKTVISGLDFAYTDVGGFVKQNIPIGYVKAEGYSVCFMGEEKIITNYNIKDSSVIWKT